MLGSILAKSLRDSWRPMLFWGLAMALLGFFLVYSYASLSPEERAAASQAMSSASDTTSVIMGDIEVPGTIGGMLNWKFFVFFPFLMAIFTVLQGTAAVAGEEESRTLDITLSCPVPRWRLVLEKFAALTISTVVVALLVTLGFWVAIAAFAAEVGYDQVFLAVLNGSLVALAAGAFAFFVTGLMPGRRTAGLATGVLLMVSYLMNTLATISPVLEPYRPLSIFYHYSRSQPLTGTVAWASAVLILGLTTLFVVGTVVSFELRDIGAGSPIARLLRSLAARLPRRRRSWAPPRYSVLYSVAGKAFRDALLAVVAWGGSLGLLVMVILLFYPMIQQLPDLDRILSELPPATRALFGDFASIFTLRGFLTVGFLSYLPVVMAVFAITEAMEALAGEEEKRTADILLSLPVPRWRVLVEKIAALLAGLLAVAIMTFGGLALGVVIVGVDLDWWRMLAAALNAVPPAAALAAVTLCISALSQGRTLGVGLGAGLVVFSYFLNTLAPMVEWLRPLQPLSVFFHYTNSEPLSTGMAWSSIGLLVLVATGFFAGAVFAFEHRDIRA